MKINPHLNFLPEKPRNIIDPVRELFPESIYSTTREADRICRHLFNLLGSGDHRFGDKIEWRKDFKSGYSWDLSPSEKIRTVNLENAADAKVPWELSRFQHLITLGKAYWYAASRQDEERNREKYAREFTSEIEDWIENNPPAYGINWTSPMEAAIRAVNWIWAYCFFAGSPLLSAGFISKFLKSLRAHGNYIYHNIEIYPGGITSNHTIFDYAGLFFLGLFLPGWRPAKRWLRRGKRGLIREMLKQTTPEGVDYEGSIYYHRLVTEVFLTALIVGRRYSTRFPEAYLSRLEKMLEFIMNYTRPDGSSPLLGDSDDGRLQIFSNYPGWDRLDHRDLLSSGAVVFSRPDFKAAAGKFYEESFWLLGERGLNKFKSLPETAISLRSRAFPRSGYYIMRRDDSYMIIDCLPGAAAAPTGHRHNSRLSFELSASGSNYIIDPGSYIYTADPRMRNLFRGTFYHNTVLIDKMEQNRFRPHDLFSLRPGGRVKVSRWETEEEYDYLEAEYTYYRRLKKPLKHRRQIYFARNDHYWLLRDSLRARGRHNYSCLFHFDEELQINFSEGYLIISGKEAADHLFIHPLDGKETKVEITDGWVSKRYGIKQKAKIAGFQGSFKNRVSFGFIIAPALSSSNLQDIKIKAAGKYQLLKADRSRK